MFDYLIVGAGFAGSVLAERLAREANKSVLIVDKRSHIGGNAYDTHNDDGILIHPYGLDKIIGKRDEKKEKSALLSAPVSPASSLRVPMFPPSAPPASSPTPLRATMVAK